MSSEVVSWASSSGARARMRANRNRDTGPELAVRRAVHALGLRYRVSCRPLPQLRRTADLVFPRLNVAVFVDGCFWHGCPEHYVPSKTNVSYWSDKIRGNRGRDRQTDQLLSGAGWIVIRIWAHENPAEAAERVARVVRDRQALRPPRGGKA
jgi:DNA mismatch endonuclease, patch repair protein